MNLPRNYQYITKKYLFELLQHRYHSNEKIIDRVSSYLVTEDDVKDFVKVVVDAYESGYLKAVNDYKEQIKKMGYEVNVVSSIK